MQQKRHDNIATIRDEYRRIDAKWLRMQYRLMLWLMVVTVTVEIVMFSSCGRSAPFPRPQVSIC